MRGQRVRYSSVGAWRSMRPAWSVLNQRTLSAVSSFDLRGAGAGPAGRMAGDDRGRRQPDG